MVFSSSRALRKGRRASHSIIIPPRPSGNCAQGRKFRSRNVQSAQWKGSSSEVRRVKGPEPRRTKRQPKVDSSTHPLEWSCLAQTSLFPNPKQFLLLLYQSHFFSPGPGYPNGRAPHLTPGYTEAVLRIRGRPTGREGVQLRCYNNQGLKEGGRSERQA